MFTRTSVVIALAFVLCICLPATSFAAGDAAKGKDLFLKKCKMCHGEDGAGTPAMQKKYPKMLPLASPEIQKMSEADLSKGIKETANHKALVKTLTDADVENLVAFVKTLKK
jgi:cytochrome c553